MIRLEDLSFEEKQCLAYLAYVRTHGHQMLRNVFYKSSDEKIILRIDLELDVSSRLLSIPEWVRQNLPDPKEHWVKEYLLNRFAPDSPAAP
ncbi:MAG TPA: hypothetical protein VFA52_00560 [Candidatus Paceibacterota bacterium]|nr:hypothetical protein [Candidatus Paceibacterota bacterium]